ncbi:MAG: DinB family protein [Vicinamibacterales bacterium]
MRRFPFVAALAVLTASPAMAQPTGARTFTEGVQRQFQQVQALVMKTAEKVGEDLYSFKPTPEVRSLGGVLGHVADGNRLLCRVASGENVDFEKIMKDPSSLQVNEKKTSKAELIAALNESKAFCESVFAKLTDATGQETVAWFGGQTTPKLMALTMNNSHAWEHYGNLVTYMRLKGIVPPSSERAPSTGPDAALYFQSAEGKSYN